MPTIKALHASDLSDRELLIRIISNRDIIRSGTVNREEELRLARENHRLEDEQRRRTTDKVNVHPFVRSDANLNNLFYPKRGCGCIK